MPFSIIKKSPAARAGDFVFIGILSYFRYLSSQPKNSRFQTIEFWGLKT